MTTVFPDEASQELNYISYDEAQAWDERARRWRSSLHCQAAQFQTNATYGPVSRLAAYTVGDLLPYTVGQLVAL